MVVPADTLEEEEEAGRMHRLGSVPKMGPHSGQAVTSS